MLPTVMWLFFVTVVFTGINGQARRTEFIAGGTSVEECEEVRENVLEFGRAAARRGGLTVKRIRATECVAVAAEFEEP